MSCTKHPPDRSEMVLQCLDCHNIRVLRVAKLEAVAQAAEKLIYPPRTIYAAGSKKAALRDALLALNAPVALQ